MTVQWHVLLRSSIKFLWRSPYLNAISNIAIHMIMTSLWTSLIIKAMSHMTSSYCYSSFVHEWKLICYSWCVLDILPFYERLYILCHSIMNRDCIPPCCNSVVFMGLILREALCNSRNANTCMCSDVETEFVLATSIGTIYWCSPYGWLWVPNIPYVIQLYV